MKKGKKIKIVSFAMFQATVLGLIGLGLGILYSFGGAAYDLFTIGFNQGTLLAFGALIGMPLILAVGGFVLGLIEGILYNFFLRFFFDLHVSFED